MNGFSVGNVTNEDKLLMDIELKVGMDIKVNQDYILELVNIEGNDFGDKSVLIDNIACKVRAISDINTLDSLEVDNVSLSPKFDKNVFNYSGSTYDDKVVISGIASDSGAKVEGDIGERKLEIGTNKFVIKVTSARGNVREYNIYITRLLDKKSSDVSLKKLTLSEGSIDFKKDNFLYFVDVKYEVSKIEVEAVANDSKAKVDIEKSDTLVVGENKINVIVTAEDGTTATYVIIVNRHEKLSNDTSIKNIIIKNYDINFSSDVYSYKLKIDTEDKLDIDVILNDDKSKYSIKGNNNLDNGSVIEIEVIAEDGSRAVYKIKIELSDANNSNSLNNYVDLFSIIGFIILVVIVLVVKIIKSIVNKNKFNGEEK